MGALLESGLVGNIGLKHLKVIKEDTINKWDKLGLRYKIVYWTYNYKTRKN